MLYFQPTISIKIKRALRACVRACVRACCVLAYVRARVCIFYLPLTATSQESHNCHTGMSQTPATKTLTAKKLLTFLT